MSLIIKIIEPIDVPSHIIASQEWDKLIKKTIHPDRKQGIQLSRYALSLCLLEKNIIINAYDIKLHEGNWEFPYHVSISHTKEICIAIIAEKNAFKSIGVDIEIKDRIISEDVKKKIMSRSKDSSMTILEIWTGLEAGFKAANEQNPELTHPLELCVDSDHFYFENSSHPIGQIQRINHPKAFISIATIK